MIRLIIIISIKKIVTIQKLKTKNEEDQDLGIEQTIGKEKTPMINIRERSVKKNKDQGKDLFPVSQIPQNLLPHLSFLNE